MTRPRPPQFRVVHVFGPYSNKRDILSRGGRLVLSDLDLDLAVEACRELNRAWDDALASLNHVRRVRKLMPGAPY